MFLILQFSWWENERKNDLNASLPLPTTTTTPSLLLKLSKLSKFFSKLSYYSFARLQWMWIFQSKWFVAYKEVLQMYWNKWLKNEYFTGTFPTIVTKNEMLVMCSKNSNNLFINHKWMPLDRWKKII